MTGAVYLKVELYWCIYCPEIPRASSFIFIFIFFFFVYATEKLARAFRISGLKRWKGTRRVHVIYNMW